MTNGDDSTLMSQGIFVAAASVVTLVFVGLKLTDHIAWSWLWVLSPTWIAALLCAGTLGLLAILDIATD